MARKTRIDTLNVEQLHHLGRQLDAELTRMNQTVNTMQGVATQYHQSGTAVEELKSAQEGQQILIPLTESLYVAGHVYQNDSLLVSIGTGYYTEKSCDDAVDFCKRKVDFLKDQMNQLGEDMRSKQRARQQVESVMRQKMQAEAMRAQAEGRGPSN